MYRQPDEVIEIVEAALRRLSEHIPVSAAYIFGSYAEGTAGEHSDIDLAVFSVAADNMNIEERIDFLVRMENNMDAAVEIHLYPEAALRQARPTNIFGHIIATGKKVA